MHEYLTIENLLKRYLVTFTIQATGTYWVFLYAPDLSDLTILLKSSTGTKY